jgi:hypothetical protein
LSEPRRRAGLRRRNPSRLSRGETIATASALLLLAFSFFDWFGVEVKDVGGFSGETGLGGSAWSTLELIPWLLLLTVVVTLAMAAMKLTGLREPAVPLTVPVTVLGALTFLGIAFRIVAPPDLPAFGGVPVKATLDVGVLLALTAAIGVAYGGHTAMREQGVTFDAVADRITRPARSAR